MTEQNCLFCNIVSGAIPASKEYEDDVVCAFHDINPQAPVHILIIPKTHIAGMDSMAQNECATVGHIMYAAQKIAKKLKVKEESYRLVFNNGPLAGQTVFHLHGHFLAGRAMQWPPG